MAHDGDGARGVASVASRYARISGPARTTERLSLAIEAVRLAEQAGDYESALCARVWRITELLELGEMEEAEAEIDLHAHFAEQRGHLPSLWRAAVFRAMRAILRGRFEEGERLVTRALEIGQRIQEPNAINLFGAQMLTLRREQGRLGEMEAVHKNFLEQHPDHAGWRCALALVYCETGREDAARVELERVCANDFANLRSDLFWLLAVATLSQVCAFVGDASRAAALYEVLAPYRERCIVVGYGAGCLGSVSHYLALLARTMGRWEAAEQHFEAALQLNIRINGPALVARTRHAHADTILARLTAEPWRDGPSERGRALDLLEPALTTYQALGIYYHRERAVAAKVRALSSAPGGVDVPAKDGDTPLPRPEAECAVPPAATEETESTPVSLQSEAAAFPVQHWATYRTLLKVRLVTCVALCVVVPIGLLLAQRGNTTWALNTWPLLGIVTISMLLGLAYRAAANRASVASIPPLDAVYVIHWIDAFLATAGMYFLGGVEVFIGVPFYALILVHTAIEVPARGAFVLAAAAAAAYAATILSVPLSSPWREPIFVNIDVMAQSAFVEHARLVLAVVNAIFLGVFVNLSTMLAGVTRQQTARARAAEARARALNRGLEKQVSERTRALNATNASLVTTNVMLETLNREIELYTKAVWHDVRSHIAAASESLRILDEPAAPDAGRLRRLAMDSLGGAERMLIGLRDLMRNRSVEPVGSVPIRALLDAVITDIRAVRNAPDLPIALTGSFFDIKGQATKIRHLFRNLIDNAVVQTRGRRDARVEVGQKVEGDTAVFWVRDNGEGIPYADQAVIFEPFRHGPHHASDGMGIGLTLVRQIVEQHSGKVWVDSVPGDGATFWVRLPVQRPARPEG